MVYLEDELLHSISAMAKERAHQIYNKIIDDIKGKDIDSTSKLCYMKYYLITLNSLIYMNCRSNFICKKRLLCLRTHFVEKIAIQSCLENMALLGNEMIEHYIRAAQEHSSTFKNPAVRDALDYIKANLSNDLTLDEVSNATHISKSYLSFLFSKCTGYSFSHYVNKLKIEKAKELLQCTKLSLMEVALECGFNSQSYFSRVFSQLEGLTPKQYRLYGRNGSVSSKSL